MKNTTVRARIIVCFSAVIVLMIALCAFAYVQLRAIQDRANEARSESVPGLFIASRLQAISISTYTSVQQLVLEPDLLKRQQIKAYLEQKTTERLEYLKKYESVIRSERQRSLFQATETALGPYMTVRRQV